jgi:tetratricopeptide (TPR) repeat protein
MTIMEDVDQALAERDYPRAASLAADAIASGGRDPSLFNLAGFAKSEAGDYEGALELLHQGLEIAPTDHFLLYSIGFCLSRLERYDGALAAFDSALQVRPGAPAPLFQKGLILSRRGDEDGALAHYDAAIAADPNYEDPLAGRATIAAQHGRFDEARAFAARALKIDPRQPLANLAIAQADLEEGEAQTVVDRLEPQLDNPAILEGDRSLFYSTIGDAFDALDRRDEAFAAWSKGKALSRQIFAEHEVGLAAVDGTARLETFIPFALSLAPMRPKPPEAPEAPQPGAPREHVFLLGFPRSGTTLLEQVLAGHPDVVTLEEKPLLEAAVREFLMDKASFERLIDADDTLLDPFRDLYWQLVRGQGLEPRGKVFIDKMPLYSLNLPLIARLFPSAKILFAERDPRDVVFSCFRRAFQINAGMYQFTSLEGSARFYDLTMTAARAYLKSFPMDVRPTRHETLVMDFEGETRALCEFLGLEWIDALTRFAERARKRSIRTPSAPQVRRGLYSSGIGQWRRYAGHLAPVMPILEHWAKTLGYGAEAAS